MGKYILAVGLLALGCGTSDESGPSLEGVWQTSLANGCALTFGFKGSSFTDNFVCELQSGGLGMEIEGGTFNKTADELDLVARESSCPPHATMDSVRYAFSGSQLVLRYPNATLILNKVTPASGPGAVVTNGCWASEGDRLLFTPGDLVPL